VAEQTRHTGRFALPVRRRVIGLLSDIAERSGAATKDGWMLLDIALSQQDLADLAGATREHVNQVLADLAASGRVRWARRHLKLRIGGGSGRRARADVRQG
jgi:CRP-like cAMP-binding protein